MRAADRIALAVLCLILAGSMSMRVYMHVVAVETTDPADERDPVDLGKGVYLSRAALESRTVPVAHCRAPATISFVEPSPHGDAASLTAPPNPADRVYYAYRGHTLADRFAATKLRVAYFARRALGLLRVTGGVGPDDLAVKLIVPADCDVSPEDVMAALRRQVQPKN